MKILYIIIITFFLSTYCNAENIFETSNFILKFNSNNINLIKGEKINQIKIKTFKNLVNRMLADKDKHKFDINISLVGSYEKKNKKILDAKISELNMINNVKVLGKVEYKKLPKLYRQHDIKIYASKSETFGMTMLEAMKCGLPILATKNQISLEILSSAGFFCKDSAKDIKNSLIKIINNQSNLKSKIKKGILIKLPKAKQDLRVDLPTIGIDTFKDCNKVGIKGIVVKSNQNIILNKVDSIKYANQNKLFLIAI